MRLAAFLVALPLAAQTAVIKTNPAPVWGPTQTWKVGATNGLDGSASTGGWSGYNWSCTAYDPGTGPISCPLMFNITTIPQPTVTSVVAGDYTIQLCDGANMHCGTAHIGAVNFDANGVVIPPDPKVTAIWGPMIALGQNPWGWEDERNLKAMNERFTTYNTPNPYNMYSDYNPSWSHLLAGTVAYHWNGTGSAVGAAGTTLSGAINATTLSIPVTDASALDLSQFPTRITVQASNASYLFEEMRICSASATSGAATLTVCYDGRGIGNASGIPYVIAAQSWSSGAIVGQQIVKGTGTSFLATMAPAGASAPAGPVTYSTGTVSVSAGTPTITGSGTSWSTMNDVLVGDAVVISAAHSSTGFLVVGFVTSVNSTTSITINRNVPTVDTSIGLSYKIVRPWYRYIVTQFTRPAPYAGVTNVNWGTTGCESDTECFFNIGVLGHDIPALDGAAISGTGWTFMDNTGTYLNSFNGGINFYGENLAWRALWYRSGLVQALQMANAIDANWTFYPSFAGQGAFGASLFLGGGVIGSWASYTLTGTPTVNNLRPFSNNSENVVNLGCNDIDTREAAYDGAWIVDGGLYDPDTVTWRPTFRGLMGMLNSRDNTCKGTSGGVHTNSWENGFYWSPAGPAIALTNSSTAGTGTGIPSNVCDGLEVGTANVTAGTSAVTAASGTFSASTNSIVLGGRYYQFNRTSSTGGNISVLWPGSSGVVTYMTRNTSLVTLATALVAFGTSGNDPALTSNYACIWNNSASITLDRGFANTTGTYTLYNANVAGKLQQPFMAGINTYKLAQSAPLDGTLALNNGALRDAQGTWVATYGLDPNTGGMFYARGCGFCESLGTLTGTLTWGTPGTRYGLNVVPDQAIQAAEELNQEAFAGLVAWYLANPSPANKATVDAAYCAIWCQTAFNVGTPGDNPNSIGNSAGNGNLNDEYLSGSKWPGFFFGMGMAHQWPAIRAGSPITTTGTSISGSVTISGSVPIQ